MPHRIRLFLSLFSFAILTGLVSVACNFPLIVARQTQHVPPVLLTPIETVSPAATDLSQLPGMLITQTAPLLQPTPGEASLPSPAPVQPENNPGLSGKIAYACYLEQQDDICLMNLSDSSIRRLTDHAATDFYPSISPDGQAILFSSNRDGNFEVFRMNMDGSDLVQLTDNNGDLYAPDLSPDGEWIVFTRERGGSQHVWRMRSDGTEPHALTEGDMDAIDPAYSPDGLWISFTSNRTGSNQLYVMESDGGSWRTVTQDVAGMGGRNTWSADSQQLAFYAGQRNDSSRNIFTVNLDGSGLRQVTDGGDNLGPSYSPDGQWIVFTSFRSGNNDLWAIRVDGSQIIQLTTDPRPDWQPRWGP